MDSAAKADGEIVGVKRSYHRISERQSQNNSSSLNAHANNNDG